MSRKTKSKSTISFDLFMVFVILFLCVFAFLMVKINSLNQTIDSYKYELSTLENKFSSLNDSYAVLNSQKLNLETNLADAKNDYDGLKKESADIIGAINTYQTEIQNALSWYKKNSVLGQSKTEERIKSRLDSYCFEIKQNTCEIKLGCFYLLNSEYFDLSYHYDNETYSKEDKLSSLTEFLDNNGGDCEDYSLFYKAEYNYVLSQCEGKSVVLKGWTLPNDDSDTRKYWLNNARTWYLDDVALVTIENFTYPNIVCGALYDPVLGNVAGRCMLAFTEKPILSSSDLDDLDGAFLIEPQDGSFRGNINQINSNVFLLTNKTYTDDSILSWIDSVISDSDYYLFSRTYASWLTYDSFDKQLQEQKIKIKDAII
ncbi:hypothetical protein JXA48_01380 [Candidatus Woesearchaeota archaeon]|nr:hypothetical protein [Candidatus Woesearchaeota archaeon]